MSLKSWVTPLPIYVTRKDAHGLTGTLSLSTWAILLILLIVWLNVLLWGGYGVYLAITTIA